MLKRFARFLNPREAGGLDWGHYCITVLAAVLVGIALGIGGTKTTEYVLKGTNTGLKRAPITAPFISAGGSGVPSTVSLNRYIVRRHQQYSSESCVWQTISTMLEIENKEAGYPTWMSPGFGYNQLVKGAQVPVSYQDSFNLAQTQGDATYAAFPYDGTYSYPQPSSTVVAGASRHHFSQWRQIALSDEYTVWYELRHGRPVAIALPWHYTLVSGNSGSPVYSDQGALYYWHSTTIVGVSNFGVEILNSFGSSWGNNGELWLSWSALQNDVDGSGYIGAMVVANPVVPHRPKPKPFPSKVWNSARKAKHQKPISPYYKGKLGLVASSWWHQQHARPGGILRPEQWDTHNRVMLTTFWWARAWSWPQHAKWPVRWVYSRKPLRS